MRAFILVYLIALTACQTKHHPEYVLDAAIVGAPNHDMYTDALADHFEDGTPIDIIETVIDEPSGQYYLYREGHNAKNECQISRTALEQDRYGYLFLSRFGKTESCKGQGCAHFIFNAKGECECDLKNSFQRLVSNDNQALFR